MTDGAADPAGEEPPIDDYGVNAGDLLEALDCGVMVVSGAGLIVRVNPRAEELLDVPRESLAGLPLDRAPWWPRLQAGDGSALAWEAFPLTTTLASGMPAEAVVGLAGPLGDRSRWLRVSSRPHGVGPRGARQGAVCTLVAVEQPAGAERRLWRRLNDLRALLNGLPDAFFLLDAEGRVLECSQRAQAIAEGAGEPAPAGRLFTDLLVRNEPEVLEALAEASAVGESRCELEWRSEEALLYCEARFVLLGDGRVGVLVRDITDRWRAEEELVELSERYRLVVDNVRDVIFRMELQPFPRLLYVSPSVEAVVGYRPDELYADPSLLYRIPRRDFVPLVRRAVASRVDFGEPLELCMIHRDGREVWVEEMLTAGRDPGGALLVLEGVMRDITERRAQAEAQRRSEARFRLLADHARDVAWHVGLGPEPNVEYVSPSVERLLGRTPAELAAPGAWRGIVAAPSQAMVEDLAAGRFDLDTPLLVAWTHKDGHTVWTDGPVRLVRDETGAAVALQGLARDVTAVVDEPDVVAAGLARLRLTAAALRLLAAGDEGSLRRIVELLTESTGSACGLLALSEPGGGILALPCGHASEARLPARRLDPCAGEAGVLGRVLVERRPLTAGDVPGVLRAVCPEGHAAAVPLAAGGEVVGALLVAGRREAFRRAHLHLLETVAVHLAPGLRALVQDDRRMPAAAEGR